MTNKITMDWSQISIVSVLTFIIGWLIFGLFDAVLLAIVVLTLMGILRFR